MSPEAEKEKQSGSPPFLEEEAPTIGLNGTVVATNKTGLRFRLKLSKPKTRNGAATDVNGYQSSESPSRLMEEDRNEEDASPGKAEESEEAHDGHECGSQESKASEKGMQIFICPECGKVFNSNKALFGHLRSHPYKGYKGMHKPAGSLKRQAGSGSSPERALNVSDWAVKAKRGRSAEQEAAIAAAETLIIISRTRLILPPCTKQVKEEESPRKCSAAAKIYECKECNKTFATHQALGGHRAGHNKYRNNSEAEALEENGAVHGRDGPGPAQTAATTEHRCKTCNETFTTGQALGGHMRRHYNGPLVAGSPEENARGDNHDNVEIHGRSGENSTAMLIDLNVAWEEEEGDRGSV